MIENASSNTMTAGEIIRALEEIEAQNDMLLKQKSRLYKMASALGHDVEAVRQVLHFRREALKAGHDMPARAPTGTFSQYLAEADDAK